MKLSEGYVGGPKSLDYTDSYGWKRTSSIVAEFTDRDGNRFFVVGPVARNTYDVSPPYNVLQYNHDTMTINY